MHQARSSKELCINKKWQGYCDARMVGVQFVIFLTKQISESQSTFKAIKFWFFTSSSCHCPGPLGAFRWYFVLFLWSVFFQHFQFFSLVVVVGVFNPKWALKRGKKVRTLLVNNWVQSRFVGVLLPHPWLLDRVWCVRVYRWRSKINAVNHWNNFCLFLVPSF